MPFEFERQKIKDQKISSYKGKHKTKYPALINKKGTAKSLKTCHQFIAQPPKVITKKFFG